MNLDSLINYNSLALDILINSNRFTWVSLIVLKSRFVHVCVLVTYLFCFCIQSETIELMHFISSLKDQQFCDWQWPKNKVYMFFSPYNLLLSHVINLLFLFICIVFVLGQVQACDWYMVFGEGCWSIGHSLCCIGTGTILGTRIRQF